MALACGIVGLPNVGKSTLFNAITRSSVVASNYPFATIDPNVGVVNVPDPRLSVLAEIFASKKIVPRPPRSSISPDSCAVRLKAKVWATRSCRTSARWMR